VAAGPELEALRLAVHRPESVVDRLQPVLFDDDLCLAAYRALAAASTLHDAIAGADPEVADLLQRVAVEDTDEDVDDVIIRLIERAGARAIRELELDARGSAVPEDYGRVIGWLKLALEDLRNGQTCRDAEARLVPWLVSHAEVADE
jgi:hypothetical protein